MNFTVADQDKIWNDVKNRIWLEDHRKIWTSVGSAGTLDQADLAKVSLHQSIIQLGTIISPPLPHAATTPAATGQLAPGARTVQAIARYNVTPVDGLFWRQESTQPFFFVLRLRYLGHVTAKLKEVDMATGAEGEPIVFTPPISQVFQVESSKPVPKIFDFVNKAYYVEATLDATLAPAPLAGGHPAAISIIKLIAVPIIG